jgi:hypothetical protein
MRGRGWNRAEQIQRVRDRIWHYLSPAVGHERDLFFEAAALLQLRETDVLKLARVHFLLSEEVGVLLDEIPVLLRRLATTSANVEEYSAERVRGAIRWPSTIAARLATGLPHMYVTAPARRAYQTNENELLVFVLDAVRSTARELGWHGTSGIGQVTRHRGQEAQRLLSHRQLLEIERRPPMPRSVARVRSGRNRRRYGSVLNAYELHRKTLGELDRATIRELVERDALAIVKDEVLFEVLCIFDIVDALRELGWKVQPLYLFSGKLRLRAKRGAEQLKVWYQTTPREFRARSQSVEVLRRHGVAAQPLRPDFVIRHLRFTGDSPRWLIGEIKLFRQRPEDGARAALQNLFAYRQAYRDVLDRSDTPQYGWGICWGAGLEPVQGEVLLSTPDHVRHALELSLQSMNGRPNTPTVA